MSPWLYQTPANRHVLANRRNAANVAVMWGACNVPLYGVKMKAVHHPKSPHHMILPAGFGERRAARPGHVGSAVCPRVPPTPINAYRNDNDTHSADMSVRLDRPKWVGRAYDEGVRTSKWFMNENGMTSFRRGFHVHSRKPILIANRTINEQVFPSRC